MSRLSNVKKRAARRIKDADAKERKHAIKRARNPKPLTKVKNLGEASPKRRAEWI